MFKRLLSYFMLSLIVLQSGIAMSHTHQLEQSGVEHHENGHFHGFSEESNQHVESGEYVEDSCHCCYGHISTAILDKSLSFSTQHPYLVRTLYSEDVLTDNTKPFLRPPIA